MTAVRAVRAVRVVRSMGVVWFGVGVDPSLISVLSLIAPSRIQHVRQHVVVNDELAAFDHQPNVLWQGATEPIVRQIEYLNYTQCPYGRWDLEWGGGAVLI